MAWDLLARFLTNILIFSVGSLFSLTAGPTISTAEILVDKTVTLMFCEN